MSKLVETAVRTTITDKRNNNLFVLKNCMDVMTKIDLNDVMREVFAKQESHVHAFNHFRWDWLFVCAWLIILT